MKKKKMSSSLIFSVCLLVCVRTCLSEDPKEMKVKPGDDVPLQCQGPRDGVIKLIRWERPDLKSEGYVFFLRNNQLSDEYQHPSYQGRVELTDPQMKDGDISVVLKNVNINDTGRYECHVGIKGRKPELISNIILKVEDSGHTAGHREEGGDEDRGGKEGGDKNPSVGLGVGLSAALLVVAVVGFLIYRRRVKQKPSRHQVRLSDLSDPQRRETESLKEPAPCSTGQTEETSRDAQLP